MTLSFPSFMQNGGGFLIQANTQKRRRLQENDNSAVFEHLEVD